MKTHLAPMHPWRQLLMYSGYPLTLQILCAVLLVGISAGALAELVAQPAIALWRLFTGGGLILALIVLFVALPTGRLPLWGQIVSLSLQAGLISALQAIVPTTAIGYLFLAVVMQAVFLFGVWVWLPLAAGIWLVWGGTAVIAAQSWLDWLGINIYAVFALVSITLAAAVYTAQHRFKQDVESLQQRLQDQYNALLARVDQTAEHATLEERQRLMHAINTELQSALRALELRIGRVISQAQDSIGQAQEGIVQAQQSTRETMERVRTMLRSLQPGPSSEPGAATSADPATLTVAALPDEPPRPWRIIPMVPLIFIGLAPLIVILQSPAMAGQALAFALVLLAFHLAAQARWPGPWFPIGVIGQVGTLTTMTILTGVTPLLLGIAVIAVQIAQRYSWIGLTIWFVLLQGVTIGVVMTVEPMAWQAIANLLLFGIVGAAFVFPIMAARRRVGQIERARALLQALSTQVQVLQAQEASLREMTVTAERHRAAREIHDTLGHYLMTIAIQIQLAHELLSEDPPQGLARLHELQGLVHEARQSLTCSLDPDAPLAIAGTSGLLQDALAVLVSQYNVHPGRTATLALHGPIDPLPHDVALALFRAAQESLTNSARHSNATRVTMTVVRYPRMISMQVCDNGTGPATAPAPGTGLGLAGLRERAALLGGICETYQHATGFVVELQIPLMEPGP